jgi:hypothetical protein
MRTAERPSSWRERRSSVSVCGGGGGIISGPGGAVSCRHSPCQPSLVPAPPVLGVQGHPPCRARRAWRACQLHLVAGGATRQRCHAAGGLHRGSAAGPRRTRGRWRPRRAAGASIQHASQAGPREAGGAAARRPPDHAVGVPTLHQSARWHGKRVTHTIRALWGLALDTRGRSVGCVPRNSRQPLPNLTYCAEHDRARWLAREDQAATGRGCRREAGAKPPALEKVVPASEPAPA